MNVRIKFRKSGIARFVGHLDVMRYFQKCFRRAEIPIAYSKGFSPHPILSIANPLSVGFYSDAEYMDVELSEEMDLNLLVKRLNESGTEDFQVLRAVKLKDSSENAMSIVTASDYEIVATESFQSGELFPLGFLKFLERDSILATKKTKKSEAEVDLKPLIKEYRETENGIFLKLLTGSRENLKPDFLLSVYLTEQGISYRNFDFRITRKEIYGFSEGNIKSLLSCDEAEI